MGFMAGLGEGFSSAFKNAEAIRASKEQDAFRVAYQDYADKKAAYAAEESKWNGNIKKGEAIASKYGASSDAALKAAEWLQAGFSDAYVDDLVSKSKFSSTPDVAQASDQNKAVDAQMGAAGLVPGTGEATANVPQEASTVNDPVNTEPLPDQANAPVQEDTGILGNILGPDGIFSHMGESDADQANRSVREATGSSQEAMNKFGGGFQAPDTSGIQVETTIPSATNDPLAEFGLEGGLTPADVSAAEVRAKQWAKSDKPEERAKAARWEAMKPEIDLAMSKDIDPQTKAELTKLLIPSSKGRQDLATQKVAVQTMAEQGKELVDMVVASDGKVLNTVSGAVSGFESLKNEAGALLDLIGKLGGEEGQDEQSVLSAALADIDKKFGGGEITAEIAQQQREFTAASIRYIFSAGKALGQAGNGFSNNDYKNIRTSLITSNDAAAFENNMKRFISAQVKQTDNTATYMQNSGEIQALANASPEMAKFVEFDLTGLSKQLEGTDLGKWLVSPMKTSKDPIKEENAKINPETPAYAVPGKVVQGPDGKFYKFNGKPTEWKDQSKWEEIPSSTSGR